MAWTEPHVSNAVTPNMYPLKTRALAVLAMAADRLYPFLDQSRLAPAFKFAIRQLAEPALKWVGGQIQSMSEEELRALILQVRTQVVPILTDEVLPFLLGEEPPHEDNHPG